MTQGFEVFEAFAARMYAPGGKGLERLREERSKPGWPELRSTLLASSEVDACARTYPPTERCVLEDLLVELGATGEEDAIARLVRIAETHPQAELRVRALHGLSSAGPAGIEACAGAPGKPFMDTYSVARSVRARAVLARGDGPELLEGASVEWKEAILSALQRGFRERPDAAVRLESERRLGAEGPWLTFVLDAYFDPALAERAEAVLWSLPQTLWKPLVAKRKKAAKGKGKTSAEAKRPTAAQIAKLDRELKAMRAELTAIVATLKEEKFAFVRVPLEAPGKGFATKLRKLEKRVGRVPLALARFWAIVGAVDLRGNHPAWAKKTYVQRGSDEHWYADPLVVVGIDGALADADDGDFDVAEAPASLKYALDLAGDDVTKANFSGGIVSVETPSDAIDPPLRGRSGTFLEMLRESIAWKGFPGLAKADDAPAWLREARRR